MDDSSMDTLWRKLPDNVIYDILLPEQRAFIMRRRDARDIQNWRLVRATAAPCCDLSRSLDDVYCSLFDVDMIDRRVLMTRSGHRCAMCSAPYTVIDQSNVIIARLMTNGHGKAACSRSPATPHTAGVFHVPEAHGMRLDLLPRRHATLPWAYIITHRGALHTARDPSVKVPAVHERDDWALHELVGTQCVVVAAGVPGCTLPTLAHVVRGDAADTSVHIGSLDAPYVQWATAPPMCRAVTTAQSSSTSRACYEPLEYTPPCVCVQLTSSTPGSEDDIVGDSIMLGLRRSGSLMVMRASPPESVVMVKRVIANGTAVYTIENKLRRPRCELPCPIFYLEAKARAFAVVGLSIVELRVRRATDEDEGFRVDARLEQHSAPTLTFYQSRTPAPADLTCEGTHAAHTPAPADLACYGTHVEHLSHAHMMRIMQATGTHGDRNTDTEIIPHTTFPFPKTKPPKEKPVATSPTPLDPFRPIVATVDLL